MNGWDILLANAVRLNPKDLKSALVNLMDGIFPNVKFPTFDSEIFWDTIAEYRGWKIQKN